MKFGDQSLDLAQPQVMGILNVTPDSFSDGGRFNELTPALRHAEQMVAEGAAIIDVGGESTRPGAQPVSEQQELDRVLPVIEAIAQRLDVLISVDTSTASVMTEASAAGAHMLNDVRALQRPGALQAAANTGLAVCLMHMQGSPDSMQRNPEYRDVVDEVIAFLQQRVDACQQEGIERERLLLDPGFGFGKTTVHNYRLLNQLERFLSLDLPVLAGVSRKRMIGEATLCESTGQRVNGSVAAAVICAMKGARLLRVHDVKATVEALRVVAFTLEQSEASIEQE